MKILLINPNTTELVTQRAVDAARAVVPAGTIVDGVTGRIGAPIINCITDNAIGTYSAIELAAEHASSYDAIVLAVSFDTGLHELREMLSIPVAGMSESAMRQGAALGNRFSLISFGERTRPMYENLVRRNQMKSHLASVRCIENLSAVQMADTQYLIERVTKELELAIDIDGADVGILSATAFAGLSDQFEVDIPLVDGITAAVKDVASNNVQRNVLGSESSPEPKQLSGVSDALKSMYLNFPSN